MLYWTLIGVVACIFDLDVNISFFFRFSNYFCMAVRPQHSSYVFTTVRLLYLSVNGI